MGDTDWEQYAATYRQIERDTIVPALLVQHCEGQSGRAIDVGCGEGDLLDRLVEQFPSWDFCGYEVSNFRADIARSRGHRVMVDTTGDLPLGDYDLAISAHVIEHVEDDVDHVRRLSGLLRAGGHAYIETPLKLAGGWYFRRSPTAGWVLDPTHRREYRSLASLTAVIESSGLTVVAHEVAPLAFPIRAALALVQRGLRLPSSEAVEARLGSSWSVPIPRYRTASVLARKA